MMIIVKRMFVNIFCLCLCHILIVCFLLVLFSLYYFFSECLWSYLRCSFLYYIGVFCTMFIGIGVGFTFVRCHLMGHLFCWFDMFTGLTRFWFLLVVLVNVGSVGFVISPLVVSHLWVLIWRGVMCLTTGVTRHTFSIAFVVVIYFVIVNGFVLITRNVALFV